MHIRQLIVLTLSLVTLLLGLTSSAVAQTFAIRTTRLPGADFTQAPGFAQDINQGDIIEYMGSGWNPSGGPIEILWGESVIATLPATAEIGGTVESGIYPPLTVDQYQNEQSRCREQMTVRQDGVTLTIFTQSNRSELVYYAENVFFADGSTPPAGEQFSLCEGMLLYTSGAVPVLAGDTQYFSADVPGIIVSEATGAGRPLSDGTNRALANYSGLSVHAARSGSIPANGNAPFALGGNVLTNLLYINERVVYDESTQNSAVGTPSSTATLASGSGLSSANIGFALDKALRLIVPPEPEGGPLGIASSLAVNGQERAFSDIPNGGSAVGEIKNPLGVSFDVTQVGLEPRQIQLDASSQRHFSYFPDYPRAVLELCDFIVRMNDGDSLRFDCASLEGQVLAGPIEVVVAEGIIANVRTGVFFSIEDLGGNAYRISNAEISQDDIIIEQFGDGGTLSPGDSTVFESDADSDGDGVSDAGDACPADFFKTEPGVCGCGVGEGDLDNDETPDCLDQCTFDPFKNDPRVCGCFIEDFDSDDDGVEDCIDGCPNDIDKIDAGVCGCNIPDTDSDGDETADCVDECPSDSNKSTVGVCGCGVADVDEDDNGVIDCVQSDDSITGICPMGVECLYQELAPKACIGVNGFLNHVNIVTVRNNGEETITATISYLNDQGVVQGTANVVLEANIKRDFIVSDLGLQPDTIGNVCVETTALPGMWAGGVTVYKPDTRDGLALFGDSFDYALYYPFSNPFTGAVSVPLNTFHLGVDPEALVANWVTISDAERSDGVGISGLVQFLGTDGEIVNSLNVEIPDGGRVDLPGHSALAGDAKTEAIGTARFIPNAVGEGSPARFLMSNTRYFYDCVESACENFRTAFVLPSRPQSELPLFGRSSPKKGELSIAEIFSQGGAAATVSVNSQDDEGIQTAVQNLNLPQFGTRHAILEQETLGSVEIQSSGSSAINVFYGLDDNGDLLYAYAIPFAASPGTELSSEFNSFLGQQNIGEFYNSTSERATSSLTISTFEGVFLFGQVFSLEPGERKRVPFLLVPGRYGFLSVENSTEGVFFSNFVERGEEFTLPFPGVSPAPTMPPGQVPS